MKKKKILILCAVLAVLAVAGAVLAVVLLGGDSGGGSKARASGMWLVGAEGSVAVTDGDGGDVPVRALPGVNLRLSLRSGYRVGTERESFGWLDLDDEKFAKLDELSEVQINKSGRKLEIEVEEGSLYFNVKKPLRDDETMEIRSSTMVMAIRGTSGWVTSVDGETFDVYIIEGKVRCTAGDEEETVRAGEHARLSLRDDEGSITVEDFTREDVPEFVLSEAREDGDLREELSDIGITVEPGDSGGPDGPDDPDDPDGPVGTDEGPSGPDDGPSGGGADGDLYYVMKPAALMVGDWDLSNVTFDYPIFYGPEEAAGRLNESMEARLREFLDLEDEIEAFFAEHENATPDTYKHSFYYDVDLLSHPGLVIIRCLEIYNDGVGGIAYSKASYLYFDAATGEELDLVGLVGGTERQVREAIKTELGKTAYGASLPEDKLDTMDLSLIEFTVSGNTLAVNFQFYLVVGGAAGVEVPFRLPLAQKYGGEGLPADGGDADAIASGDGWSIGADGVLTLTAEAPAEVWESGAWRRNGNSVTKVIVEDGVTAISGPAFTGLTELREAVLPEGLVSIGDEAFLHCRQMESVTLPESLESIGESAFKEAALTSLVIPGNVTQIGPDAFMDCKSLREVTVLGPVETLSYTFVTCSQLSSVSLPEGVRSFSHTFYGCSALTGLTLPSTLLEVGDAAFFGAGLTSLTVPEGVTDIGGSAFANCSDLVSLSLPSTLTRIGNGAFSGTSALETISFAGTREQWVALIGENSGLSDAVTVECGG